MTGLLTGFPAIITAVTSPIGLLALGLLLVASLAVLMTDKLASGLRAGVFLCILFCFVLVILVLRPSTASVERPGKDALADDPKTAAGDPRTAKPGRAPTDSSLPGADDYILPGSATDVIDPATLAGFSALKLRLARNEIYARHGMIFTGADTKGYFETRSWYRPVAASVDLSPIEQRNVLIIRQMEAGRG